MKRFVFDGLVDADNIVNQKEVIAKLTAYVQKGACVALYGRRNTAKTSIIKNVIIPEWCANSDRIALYVDLMAVKDEEDVSSRLMAALNHALARNGKLRTWMQQGRSFLKSLRPTLSIDNYGNMEFSVKGEAESKVAHFEKVIAEMGHLHRSGTPCLICLDEFQDISLVSTLEAKLRRVLQELPSDLPVVMLGSKQHLLTEILEKPRAPFYQWGLRLKMEEIEREEYTDYLLERFPPPLNETPRSTIHFLQDLLFGAPESVHRLSFEAMLRFQKPLTPQDILTTLAVMLDQHADSFEAKLAHYTRIEVSFLRVVARIPEGVVMAPHSKDFLPKVGVSSAGMTKMLKKLLNEGILESRPSPTGKGYALTDPLLIHYLRHYRAG